MYFLKLTEMPRQAQWGLSGWLF